MSSSAGGKPVKEKSTRVGPPMESRLLKALKDKQQADQQARTDALVAEYKDLALDPDVDLYEVGRARLLNESSVAEVAQPFTESNAVLVDFSESAGVWKGERRSFGIVLTRGFGELLVITESTSSPGEFHVKYDAPFKEGSAVPE